MDLFGSRELNFSPTTRRNKKEQEGKMRVKYLHYITLLNLLNHWDVYVYLYELTLLQHRMDALSVFENSEVLQQDGLQADYLLLIGLLSHHH